VYLNIDELSEYLGMKKSSLYARVEAGEIPHYRVGRLLRFRLEDIEGWMDGHRQENAKMGDTKRSVVKKEPSQDIDRIVQKAIAEAKGLKYSPPQRETRPSKGLRKEGKDGAL